MSANHSPGVYEVRPDPGMFAGHLEVERQDRNGRENRLNEALSMATTPSGVRPMDAMEQLGSRDRGEADRLPRKIRDERISRMSLALQRDENAGVDQEAQGSSPAAG